ncbi:MULTISPECIES: GNAT family N-acetyltransferase [Pseudoalteromonas]|uniref:Acetyltransferase n=1 Tax=Pseudoalteromonas luteoviolacea (strain 2ta16) TaxID=1353533 RepID=V4HTB7_PSEL2|nr:MULTISPECIES: GNAT family protein [Pseudoalteromonas]ESP91174.1 acetyltransferase [Pseudoalteromonas luteoviolacea 2ta16]KZN41293.1 hypothetical protein N483_15470 [Pseudoalteromonas luteoviolacea NCIMB 1944]MCG7550228.1 GNAT family N-acetyltransferase [Pseudoalteromonas sp. Of7M-16]
MQFETERLIIRPLQSSDLHAVYDSRRNLETSKYIGKPETLDDVKKRIEEARQPFENLEGQRLLLTLECKSSGDFIGEMLFKHTQLASRIGEIGYRLSPKKQKKGYAFEAASALISRLFAEFDLNKITAICATENTASWQLMEKLGMKKEGCLREYMLLQDRCVDSYLYSILKREHVG